MMLFCSDRCDWSVQCCFSDVIGHCDVSLYVVGVPGSPDAPLPKCICFASLTDLPTQLHEVPHQRL